MKTRYLLPLLALIVLAACNSKPEKIELITEKIFTDTLHIDTFKVVLKGKELKDRRMVFTIHNYKGVEIYNQEINAETLLNSYFGSDAKKKEDEKMKFLNDEVSFFFEEEHFLLPAVMADEKPDKNAPDKNFYEELKQTQLHGFSYSLGKDKQIYIAWSEKEKQVKVYYKCC